MGEVRTPQPVKLIASILGGQRAELAEAEERLLATFGCCDYRSELLAFDHTDYYQPEMGPGLQRRILAFQTLIDPGELPTIKRQTNELERQWTTAGNRRVNLDPGYVSPAKLVLATTKNHGHRIYVGQGIYAEVTLGYRAGHFQSWPWSYPDYASPEYRALFEEIRRIYLAQLRATPKP